jgi:hypothetical protein
MPKFEERFGNMIVRSCPVVDEYDVFAICDANNPHGIQPFAWAQSKVSAVMLAFGARFVEALMKGDKATEPAVRAELEAFSKELGLFRPDSAS